MQKTLFSSNEFTLGILGGGQLGKMMLYDTRRLDLKTKVLDPDPDAPARLACNEFVTGSLLDYGAVYNFGLGCDVLTIEIENVCTDALEDLAKTGVQVYPQPSVLRIIQDKTIQKQFYIANKIPTAPFFVVENKSDLLLLIQEKKVSLPCVWKAPKFGYDGKGVQIIRQISDIDSLPEGRALIETKIALRKELAVIVARNADGETATFPLVEMDFHGDANLVELVGAPADVSAFTQVKATELAIQVADNLGIVGILAVEMFLTEAGEILVNEVAPRPHNSGHLFSDAAYTSQFEQHLRCILGLPFGSTDLHTPAVMVNLVGAEGYAGAVHYENMDKTMAMDKVVPHIYGKRETRPFRKMGHINVLADTLADAYAVAAKVQKMITVKTQGER